MTEAHIQAAILKALGSQSHVRLFRNHVAGIAWQGTVLRHYKSGNLLLENPRKVRCGLAVGSGDLIGGVTHDGIMRFLSIEVKSPNGRLSTGQFRWMCMVNKHGGIAFVARSVDQAEHELLAALAT